MPKFDPCLLSEHVVHFGVDSWGLTSPLYMVYMSTPQVGRLSKYFPGLDTSIEIVMPTLEMRVAV